MNLSAATNRGGPRHGGRAVRRRATFSGPPGAIEALAGRDEEFRSLCADFAEAEAALQRWAASASPVREQRCAEYRDLVDSLADEIEAALDAAKAAPLAADIQR